MEIFPKNQTYNLGRYAMKTIGLFEAKQKLSELVERASGGEQIGITKRGKLAAIIMPPRRGMSLGRNFHRH